MKRCGTCGQDLPLTEYHANKAKPGGLQSRCKACRAARRAEAYGAERARLAANAARAVIPTPAAKRCNRCGETKAPEDFHIERRRADGLRSACKVCVRDSRDTEWYRAYQQAWRAANPAMVRERKARRRARRQGAPEVERISRAAVIARDASTCQICGLVLAPRQVELDHIVPLAAGGSHIAANLQVACRTCNARKGSRV